MGNLKELRLEFIGEPTAKAATKHVFMGGKMHGFKPRKTQHAMDDLRAQLRPQLPKDWKAIEGPIHMFVTFRRPRPACDPRRLHPHTRPDLDNYLKLLFDALNGIIFRDDAQIVWLGAQKVFGSPGIEVNLYELPAKAEKLKKRLGDYKL